MISPRRNETLKKILKERKLLQKQVAFAAKIPEQKFSNLVNGYLRPTKKEAADIAFLLETTAAVIFPNGTKE